MPITQYRRELRSAVRGLWSGVLDFDQFFDSFDSSIRRNFANAWNEGASQFGRLPGEMSTEERVQLQQLITREIGFITGFGEAIEAESKENGGKLTPLYRRTELWVNRWNDPYNAGKLAAAENRKLRWVLHADESCTSCLKVANKVKLASTWQAAGYRPQNPDNLQCMLDAGGVTVCKCQFEETDAPLSRGPLPRLP